MAFLFCLCGKRGTYGGKRGGFLQKKHCKREKNLVVSKIIRTFATLIQSGSQRDGCESLVLFIEGGTKYACDF